MEFKDRLKQARIKKKFSQQGLADNIGVHVTNISRYERDENKPTTEVLNKLALALDTTTDFLMNGSAEDVADNSISDKELISLFKRVSNLSVERKKIVIEVVDSLIFKTEIQQKLAL